MNKKIILGLILAIALAFIIFLLSSTNKNAPGSSLVATPTPVPVGNINKQENRDREMFNQINDFERKTHPDVFLSNYTPYSSTPFSISSSISGKGSTAHFVFKVKLITPNAKNDFINWAKSLGLTDSQIQSLDITYQ